MEWRIRATYAIYAIVTSSRIVMNVLIHGEKPRRDASIRMRAMGVVNNAD